MTDTPSKAFIASYRIGDFPNAGLKLLPWTVAPCDGVLINAYDFLNNGRTLRYAKSLLEQSDPLRSLKLPDELILDSGAYYFVRSKSADINPRDIVDLAVRLRVSEVVTLDHPFPPGQSVEEITRRISTTAANTEKMHEQLEGILDGRPSLIPALHGHDEKTLHISYKSQPIIRNASTRKVGVGSLAPLAQKGAMREAARAMMCAREILAGKHMHVFSVGSPLVMHFAFLCGADSVDSQSWMMSAAFKQAHLPGLPQIRLSTRERARNEELYDSRRKRFELQLLKLQRSEKFVVKDWASGIPISLRDEKDAREYTDSLEDGSQGNRVHWRACHNLAVGTFEARRITAELALGTVANFLDARHATGPYRNVIFDVIETLCKKGLLCEEHGPRSSHKLEERNRLCARALS
jgi:queuine/archaeosine tRNA-ribosyltransferase